MINEMVSVIVPIYNIEQYIDRCVKSIINQSYTNLEIILVDDGSTDGSSAICDSYTDKRIKVIHKENGGLGFARNAGLDIATGRYVAFVDGDDEITNDHIEKMYKLIVSTQADTCLCGHIRVFANTKVINRNHLAGSVFEGQDVLKKVLSRMTGSYPGKSDEIEMSVWSKLFSNEIIQSKNIRFHSEREFISEDLIFDFDYFPNATRVAISDDVGYLYHDNQGSLTTKYNPNRYELHKVLTNEEIRRAKALDIINDSEVRIINTFMSLIRYCIKLEVKYLNENSILRNRVAYICNDKMVKEALKTLEYKDIPWKTKIVNWLIKKENITFLIFVMRLKNIFNI